MSPYTFASTSRPLLVAEPEVGYSGGLKAIKLAALPDSPPPGSGPALAEPTDPDPTSPDALEALGDEIATLAAHIHAATQRFLALVAEFDARRGWEWAGHRSCAHWLAARTGYTLATAQEKVRVARTLAGLPETSAAMARGELSFSQVRALVRVATPDTEEVLLELGRGLATDKLERMVRGWRRGTREEEANRERDLYDTRTFSVFPDEEGMYLVRGKLPPEIGALLMRAIEAASDTLYREAQRGRRERAPREGGCEGSDGASADAPNEASTRLPFDPELCRKEAAQRRADAVGLLAERALAAGLGAAGLGTAEGTGPTEAGEDPTPISGTRAERYQVILHVEAKALVAEDGHAPRPKSAGPGSIGATKSGRAQSPRCELEDGTRLSAESARRLCCDAGVVRMVQDREGRILDVGRRTRTIPPSLRRALEARDRGCRFPGCGSRFTDAHHVRHWADGGATSLGNCLLLCRFHHRLVHEEGWRVEWWGAGKPSARRPVFLDPRGGTHFDGRWTDPRTNPRTDPGSDLPQDPGQARRQDPPQDTDLAQTLVTANLRRGASPDGWTASIDWTREEEVPDDVYFPAIGALGEVMG